MKRFKLTNKSTEPVTYLMKLQSEKHGGLYSLNPGESLEAKSIVFNKDAIGLDSPNDNIYLIGYHDWGKIQYEITDK